MKGLLGRLKKGRCQKSLPVWMNHFKLALDNNETFYRRGHQLQLQLQISNNICKIRMSFFIF